jgi:hypothetical protein
MISRRRKLPITNILGKVFLGAVLALALFFGYVTTPAFSQVTAPVGETEEVSSQLVFWYDEVFFNLGRLTFIQVTNTSPDPVTLHFQVFRNSPGVICDEIDFVDNFTGNDTHVYDMGLIFKNDPTLPPVLDLLLETKGFVVVTPVNNVLEREAISWNHMIGSTYILDTNAGTEYMLNAMGREAVSFTLIPPGLPVPDGTLLDGVEAGYVVLQPDVLKFNYTALDQSFEFLPDFADVVSISFSDNYNGPFGAYHAQPGFGVSWQGLIFDSAENLTSGCDVTQNCFFDIGLNAFYPPANPFLGEEYLCGATNFNFEGWVKIEVGGLGPLQNEIGIFGTIDFFGEPGVGVGGATYMHVE